MKKANIESGSKSCRIFPYNPSAIPSEAYLPKYVYSVDMSVTNPDLFNQIEVIYDTKTDRLIRLIRQQTAK